MTTYCEVGDLLLGDIPLPAAIDPQKYVQMATDEIDSHIGFIYQTPVDVSDTSTVPRAIRLLLKRLCQNLATGRIILAVGAGGEKQKLHAYGQDLVKQATDALCEIGEGKINLLGVPLLDAGSNAGSLPQISQEDAESQVAAFYNRILVPGVRSGSTLPYTAFTNDYVPW